MCGIVGSFDIEKVKSLVEEVKKRGTVAFSLSAFDIETLASIIIENHPGVITAGDVAKFYWEHHDKVLSGQTFYIAHMQSPTSSDEYSYHPATLHPSLHSSEAYPALLWHNGMADNVFHQTLKDKDGKLPWDTLYLLEQIRMKGPEKALTEFQGSFACFFSHPREEGVFVFRNAISPMFFDKKTWTFCSIPFQDSEKLPANEIFHLTIDGLVSTGTKFANTYNPFGV